MHIEANCNHPGLVSDYFPLRKQPKPAPATEQTDVARLSEVVSGLTHQVHQLALILDEIREELVWAVRNDKFCAGYSQQYVANLTATREEPEEEELDEPEHPPLATNTPVPAAKPKETLFD